MMQTHGPFNSLINASNWPFRSLSFDCSACNSVRVNCAMAILRNIANQRELGSPQEAFYIIAISNQIQ